MALAFFLDALETRSHLQRFAVGSAEAFLTVEEQAGPWDGELPSRNGEYFYDSPWILSSREPKAIPPAFSQVFSADSQKDLETVCRSLAYIERLDEWAIFPWGGYARYGMLGLVAPASSLSLLECAPIFHYSDVSQFGATHKGVISRRGSSSFGASLWKGIEGEREAPLIVSFEYYEEAFQSSGISFSVDGSFREADDSKTLSVYRMNDYAAFAHFISLANQVFPFDVLPRRLNLQQCERTRRLTSGLAFSEALEVTPWFLIYNGGEIDTNNVLFAASVPQMTANFVKNSAESLSHISYF